MCALEKDHEMKISAHDTETISDRWNALENIETTSDVSTSRVITPSFESQYYVKIKIFSDLISCLK